MVFPVSQEDWAKYQPTAEEYGLMVESFEAANGIDAEDELRTMLATASTFHSTWDDAKYEYDI